MLNSSFRIVPIRTWRCRSLQCYSVVLRYSHWRSWAWRCGDNESDWGADGLFHVTAAAAAVMYDAAVSLAVSSHLSSLLLIVGNSNSSQLSWESSDISRCCVFDMAAVCIHLGVSSAVSSFTEKNVYLH